MTTDLMNALTAAEREHLADCEAKIRRGLEGFLEVGGALLDVRENRLYRAEFATFEDYCQARWGFTYQRAHQLISAADVVSTIVETGLPAPTNEGQARELGRIPEDERADVWRETLDRTDGKPTAAAVREVAREHAPDRGESFPRPQAHPEGMGAAGFAAGDDDSAPVGAAVVDGVPGSADSPAPAVVTEPVDAGMVPDAATASGSPVAPVADGPASTTTGPSTEAGLFPDHAEGDARRDRELDDAMADTAVRFRRNFGDQFGALPKLWQGFLPERVAEVYARDFQHSIADVLDQFEAWAAQVRAAHRRQTSGLRIVAGGRS